LESIWLIQRCKKRYPETTGSFDEVFRLDYMGSSEFEWGVVPKSLNRVLNVYKKYEITRFDNIKNYEGVNLMLFHNFDKIDLDEYTKFLTNASIGTESLKESSDLYYNIIGKTFNNEKNKTEFKDSYLKVDLWWDILNDVFFFFGDDIKNTLIQTLQNTEMKRKKEK
jgi:hypothetical protein